MVRQGFSISSSRKGVSHTQVINALIRKISFVFLVLFVSPISFFMVLLSKNFHQGVIFLLRPVRKLL